MCQQIIRRNEWLHYNIFFISFVVLKWKEVTFLVGTWQKWFARCNDKTVNKWEYLLCIIETIVCRMLALLQYKHVRWQFPCSFRLIFLIVVAVLSFTWHMCVCPFHALSLQPIQIMVRLCACWIRVTSDSNYVYKSRSVQWRLISFSVHSFFAHVCSYTIDIVVRCLLLFLFFVWIFDQQMLIRDFIFWKMTDKK